jgi:hypothetical protein
LELISKSTITVKITDALDIDMVKLLLYNKKKKKKKLWLFQYGNPFSVFWMRFGQGRGRSVFSFLLCVKLEFKSGEVGRVVRWAYPIDVGQFPAESRTACCCYVYSAFWPMGDLFLFWREKHPLALMVAANVPLNTYFLIDSHRNSLKYLARSAMYYNVRNGCTELSGDID